MNYEDIGSAPGDPGAFKSLSYYLGFLAVFVLVASTIKTQAAMDTVVRALVIGATIVAFSAIYESRTGYNAFDHLAEWIPALIREDQNGVRAIAAGTSASTPRRSTRSRSRLRSS